MERFDRWLKADHLQGWVCTARSARKHARSLTIDQVVVEDVYSQAEKRLRPAPVLYFRETKKGLVLSGTNQDALQALFGDDVTSCFGNKVLLEPTPMRVASREHLTAVRVWSSASSQRRRATGPHPGWFPKGKGRRRDRSRWWPDEDAKEILPFRALLSAARATS